MCRRSHYTSGHIRLHTTYFDRVRRLFHLSDHTASYSTCLTMYRDYTPSSDQSVTHFPYLTAYIDRFLCLGNDRRAIARNVPVAPFPRSAKGKKQAGETRTGKPARVHRGAFRAAGNANRCLVNILTMIAPLKYLHNWKKHAHHISRLPPLFAGESSTLAELTMRDTWTFESRSRRNCLLAERKANQRARER